MANKKSKAGYPKGRAWKLERASVHGQGKQRPRSNKYSGSDASKKPAPGERSRVWVGGYVRADGTEVKGHYRKIRGPIGEGIGVILPASRIRKQP
jgi:hypothetical protein